MKQLFPWEQWGRSKAHSERATFRLDKGMVHQTVEHERGFARVVEAIGRAELRRGSVSAGVYWYEFIPLEIADDLFISSRSFHIQHNLAEPSKRDLNEVSSSLDPQFSALYRTLAFSPLGEVPPELQHALIDLKDSLVVQGPFQKNAFHGQMRFNRNGWAIRCEDLSHPKQLSAFMQIAEKASDSLRRKLSPRSSVTNT